MSVDDVPRGKKVVGGTNFLISIKERDQQNWKGSIQWLDTGRIINFRSTLEMMNLIDEAISIQSGEGETSRSWTMESIMRKV